MTEPVIRPEPDAMPGPETAAPATPRRRGRTLVALAALLALGVAAVYGIGGFDGNATDAIACRSATATASALKPLATGEVAAFTPAETALRLDDLAFTGADGRPTTLAAWKGRVVLLNLWATWCVPCRKEMPALDRLQRAAGSPDFEVVALNIDTRDPNRPGAFLDEIGVHTLARPSDPTLGVFKRLQKLGIAHGLPTTVLIDRSGCRLGVMAGPAEWDGPEARALIDRAVASGS